MGILDTHAVEIKKILDDMNEIQEELRKLYQAERKDHSSIDYDEGMIGAYRRALEALFGGDCVVEDDEDGMWHIYARWD